MLWLCYGCINVVLTLCYGFIMVVLTLCYGCVMAVVMDVLGLYSLCAGHEQYGETADAGEDHSYDDQDSLNHLSDASLLLFIRPRR